MTRELSPLGRAATAYTQKLGFAVFPCQVQGKEPDGRLARRGFLDASKDSAQIAEWWTTAPGANIGVSCVGSGVVVVDVDPRNGGVESLAALERELGPLPPTWTCATGGGGEHRYFRDEGAEYVAKLGAGVDLKAKGYVVAPPSLHPSGTHYLWRAKLGPLDLPLAELPDAWLDRATQRPAPPPLLAPTRSSLPTDDYRRRLERASRYVAAMPEAISGSGGHEATFRVAVALVRGFSLHEDDALRLLIAEYNPRCKPRWTLRELLHKVKQAATRSTAAPGYLLRDDGRAA